MRVAWISHPSMEHHDTGTGHPERPARFGAVTALDLPVARVEAPLVTPEALRRAHADPYVATIEAHTVSGQVVQLDPDTVMGPGSLEAARRAAGAVEHAVDLVMAGTHRAAFCAVRPPGHHAERGKAMGFCLFNNVAIGALHALEAHGLERVAVIDFDVHHGNGTENILAGEPRAVFCSSFQHPLYPNSGVEPLAPNMWPVPVPAGTDGAAWRALVEAAWFERLDAWRPQLVFISAGFDAHEVDPLAQLRLREDDFAWITTALRSLADRHAQGRIVSTLEGGYDLAALASSARAHVEALSA